MKYFKILAAALAAFTVASCSNDSDDNGSTNTASDVKVCMTNTTARFREKSGIVNVPVTVEGTSNGYITLTCTCTEYGDEAAIEDAHYYMTSKTINIEPGATSAYFELATVDDPDINEDRTFLITLTECKGAEIVNPNSCVVTLRDDDAEPYYLVSGEWKCPSYDYYGNPQTLTANFQAYDEGESGYMTKYLVSGLTVVPIEAEYAYDEFTGTGTVSFTYGQESTYSGNPTMFAWLNGNSIGADGTAVFEWNDNYTELNFVEGPQSDAADFVVLVNEDGWYLYSPLVKSCTKFTR